MSEHSIEKDRRNKTAEDRLAKQYGDIGIKAVAGAVKSRTNNLTETAAEEENPASNKRNKSRKSNQ